MIGFIIGFACLYGMVRVARGRGWRGRRGWRERGGEGRHFWLRRMFERLDTSPGQEKTIRNAVDEFHDEALAAKEEFGKTRHDIGRAFSGDYFDESVMGATFARHDDTITRVRMASVGLLGKVHEALDAEQRKLLARFLERGRPWGGPYRSWS